ncbi:hypothetical protein [Methylovulum miyakonense]|nr:hypothetical protein [Methylovulum miyakonense]
MKRMAIPNDELKVLRAENRLKAALYFFSIVFIASVMALAFVGG